MENTCDINEIEAVGIQIFEVNQNKFLDESIEMDSLSDFIKFIKLMKIPCIFKYDVFTTFEETIITPETLGYEDNETDLVDLFNAYNNKAKEVNYDIPIYTMYYAFFNGKILCHQLEINKDFKYNELYFDPDEYIEHMREESNEFNRLYTNKLEEKQGEQLKNIELAVNKLREHILNDSEFISYKNKRTREEYLIDVVTGKNKDTYRCLRDVYYYATESSITDKIYCRISPKGEHFMDLMFEQVKANSKVKK